jgi:hypothetical protein
MTTLTEEEAKYVTDIQIFVLDGHEVWSQEVDIRKATPEDLLKWSDFKDLKLGTPIAVLAGEFSLECYSLLVTAEELAELEEGGNPRHLPNYYDRVVMLSLEENL